MTEVVNDTVKGTTYGDPDGPSRYIDTLDCEVPTYIDPRIDLISKHHGRDKAFKRVDYHVPYQMRGDFKVGHWPKEIQMKYGAEARTDLEGYVLCFGLTLAGIPCKGRATNRTLFCPSHGGALHPADKKMASMSTQPIPADRVANLDRVQKFMQGFLDPWDLNDDEIQGGYVRNSDGFPVRGQKLGAKFQAILAKELHRRLNEFLQSETSDMLHVMVNIAKNELYEAADRIKAAQWVAEKTMGKAPDVLVHSTQDAPYVSILDSLESGSREDYRKAITSSRVEDGSPYEIIDAQIEPDHGYLDPMDSEVVSAQSSAKQESGDGESDVLAHARSVQQTREDKQSAVKRIKKAKQRRFAARAVGATSLTAIPWLVEFLPFDRDDRGRSRVCAEKDAVGFKMKLYPPDKQTPALLDRLRGVGVGAGVGVVSDERNDDGELHGQPVQ
jgi:hypothetical protein